MRRMRLRGLRLLIDRRQAHLAHQSADSVATYIVALSAKELRHLARAIERVAEELFVDLAHEQKVQSVFALACVVVARAGDADQLALAANAEPRMLGFKHPCPPSVAQRPKAL